VRLYCCLSPRGQAQAARKLLPCKPGVPRSGYIQPQTPVAIATGCPYPKAGTGEPVHRPIRVDTVLEPSHVQPIAGHAERLALVCCHFHSRFPSLSFCFRVSQRHHHRILGFSRQHLRQIINSFLFDPRILVMPFAFFLNVLWFSPVFLGRAFLECSAMDIILYHAVRTRPARLVAVRRALWPSGAPCGRPDTSGAPCGRPDTSGAPCGRQDTSGAPCGRPDTSGAPCGRQDTSGAPCGRQDTSGAPCGRPDTSGAPCGRPDTSGAPCQLCVSALRVNFACQTCFSLLTV
jgi:hypothetical protein